MLLTDAARSGAESRADEVPADSSPAVVLGAGVKALIAAASGLLLTCGLGVLIWAVTPSSGDGPLPLLRAGVSAFAAANGMTVTIGRASLTLPPLMLTLVAMALLTAVSGRGRIIARDRTQEVVSVLTAAAVYGLVVTGAAVALGTRGAVRADQWWRPALLAVVVIGCTVLVRGEGWRRYLLDRLPGWVPVSVRLGVVTVAAILGGGAVTLIIGLVRSVSDASTVQSLAAPGAAGGFGLTLLGIAYLPNAVVAGAGYASGVGFTIGNGSYSPFGSTPVELPAVSLLTAAPDGHAFAKPTLLLLLFPLLTALLVGRAAVRRLEGRIDRLFAVGGAALQAGFVLAMLAAAASGGVVGGEWSSSGVPPVLFGAVVAVVVGAIGGAVAGVARVRPIQHEAAPDVEDDDTAHPDVVPEAGAQAEPVAQAVVAEAEDAAEAVPVAEAEPVVDAVPEAEDPGVVADAAGEESEPESAADETGIMAVDEVESDEPEVDDAEAAEPATDDEAAAAIPSPREEDVLADELADGDDPDAALVAGLARRTKPRRIG